MDYASKTLALMLPRLRSVVDRLRLRRPRNPRARPSFDELVRRGPRPGVDATSTPEQDVARLLVTRGMHSGAHLALAQREYSIGSGRDCDIVLRDAGIAPLHARIVFENDEPLILPAQPDGAPPFARELIGANQHVVSVRYDLGPAALSLEFQPRGAPGQRGAGWNAQEWTTRRALIVGAAATLMVTSLLLGIVYSLGGSDPNARAAALTQRLAGLGFADVRVDAQDSGELRVAGYVATAADKTRLADTLAREGINRKQIVTRAGDELVAQVRNSLASDELRVSYAGVGHVSVTGSTSDPALKDRLRTLAIELRGAIEIDDRVAHVEAKAERKPKNRALSVKIVNVLPGENGYFQTDTGARYFEGSVMPDGAQVVKIDSEAIVFRLEEQEIVYSLQ